MIRRYQAPIHVTITFPDGHSESIVAKRTMKVSALYKRLGFKVRGRKLVNVATGRGLPRSPSSGGSKALRAYVPRGGTVLLLDAVRIPPRRRRPRAVYY